MERVENLADELPHLIRRSHRGEDPERPRAESLGKELLCSALDIAALTRLESSAASGSRGQTYSKSANTIATTEQLHGAHARPR